MPSGSRAVNSPRALGLPPRGSALALRKGSRNTTGRYQLHNILRPPRAKRFRTPGSRHVPRGDEHGQGWAPPARPAAAEVNAMGQSFEVTVVVSDLPEAGRSAPYRALRVHRWSAAVQLPKVFVALSPLLLRAIEPSRTPSRTSPRPSDEAVDVPLALPEMVTLRGSAPNAAERVEMLPLTLVVVVFETRAWVRFTSTVASPPGSVARTFALLVPPVVVASRSHWKTGTLI